MSEAPIAAPPNTRWRFKARSASALFLAIPAVACVSAGSPYVEGLVLAAAAVLLWEWCRLCSARFPRVAFAALAVCVAAATVLTGFEAPVEALLTLFGGALAVYMVTGDRWLGAGALYIGVPSVALVWLRGDVDLGLETVLWIFALVWATDIGGYVFGRLIGGWKLAPRLSPNKTWAGFVGASVCAGVVGAVTGFVVQVGSPLALAVASVIIGAATQGGDLFESWVKRRFGVKDASQLIPGHGGLLDRVDGLLAASALTALITLVGNGSILKWI